MLGLKYHKVSLMTQHQMYLCTGYISPPTSSPYSDDQISVGTCICTDEHRNCVFIGDLVDKNSNWTQLCFLESLYIKRLNPALNAGIKATKELNLFR